MTHREASSPGSADERTEAGGAEPVHLSVIIPAFDARATLGAQLDALGAQDPGFGWEVVVADNGSTDGTADLVRERSVTEPRVRLVDASARRGAAAARNIGATHAVGRHLAFCDADDVVGTDWVGVIGTALAEHTFVAGRLEWATLNGDVTRASRLHDTTDGLGASTLDPRLLRGGGGNMGITAEVFRAVGGFCEEAPTLEDIDLCYRVQLAGEPLVFVPDAVVHYRLRGSVRAFARQAFAFGRGERWLDHRYVEVHRAAHQDHPTVPADGAVRGRRPGRVVSRMIETCRALVRVRSVGDLARVGWDVCFGLGYARPLDAEPEPVRIEDLDRVRSDLAKAALRSAPGRRDDALDDSARSRQLAPADAPREPVLAEGAA